VPSPRINSRPSTPDIVIKVVTAIVGGYGLAAIIAAAFSIILPAEQADDVLIGTMASFAVYAGAVIWIFTARRPRWLWLGLLIPAAIAAAILAARGSLV